MSKFSGKQVFPVAVPDTRTHEGAPGYTRTARSELFIQAVAEMAEDSFYETAAHRQARLAANVKRVVAEQGGWSWICELVSWLRNEGNMRSVSIMIAAEAVAAYKGIEPRGAGVVPTARQLVSSACLRADEPAEFLGYWLTNHGRSIPAPVKRGVADAAVRLYTERNVLKWDGQSKGIRFGDVIELTHPTPKDQGQSALFKQVIDNRHNRDGAPHGSLAFLNLDYNLQRLPVEGRRVALSNAIDAGWSWERLAGWLPGGMDAEAWEAVIPNMGYMALLRNLRNFEQAGVSDATKKFVVEKLADPEEVARSRQFPYRFLSAWKASNSLEWATALERATNLSVQNIPEFEGRTLILVDTSGSMQSPVGGARSQAARYEVAALFGSALALRNAGKVDLAIYASQSKPLTVKKGGSILRSVDEMRSLLGVVGHGTNTWEAIGTHYNGHDRIVVLTDEQSHDYGTNPGCWLHFVNLAGYKPATAPQDRKTFAYGGFTDAMFSLLPIMERGTAQRWPWQ